MTLKNKLPGLLLCSAIASIAWILGQKFPLIGSPILGILGGITVSMFLKGKNLVQEGIVFASKKILQCGVIFLGAGMNLFVIFKIGQQAFPVIVATICTSLLIAFLLQRRLEVSGKIATLIGVGSAVCGGSAIVATAPVIGADDDEVAQAISVIFLFNLLAALFFPMIGSILGFSTQSGEGFGLFAGATIHDTSSVTAAATTWDAMYGLKDATLNYAITVKLTRTLAIIPIILVLSISGKERQVNLKANFPKFILWFLLMAFITTVATEMLGISTSIFEAFRTFSRFCIVVAMSAIGLNTNLVKLIQRGGKLLIIGGCCSLSIVMVALGLQYFLGLL